MAQVGGAFVRIRPYVSEEDARALEALRDLARELCAAFDKFYTRLDRAVVPAVAEVSGDAYDALAEGERDAA